MSCELLNYNGKEGVYTRRLRATIAAADISDSEMAASDSVHNGILTFNCASLRSGKNDGTGVIKQAVIKVNNDATAAITAAFKLYLFTNADLTAQTTNAALSLDSADWEGYTGIVISFAAAAALPNTAYKSYSRTAELFHKYKTDDDDYALYGILAPDAAVTFAAAATITIDLWVECD